MTKQIHIVVNPAAGADEPILNTLNTVFQEQEVAWTVSVTHQAGDARRFARQAAQEGVDIVAAYGGDGTVSEVAEGLLGTDVPLAILPGGTSNVLAQDLAIPAQLGQAARLACGVNSRVDRIDVGKLGDRAFLLRLGIGFEATVVAEADRAFKDHFGILAYWWSTLKSLGDPSVAEYELVLDGEEVTCKGFLCTIANSGNLGPPGLQLGAAVSIQDGLLDVIIVEDVNLRSLTGILGEVFGSQFALDARRKKVEKFSDEIEGSLRHWQAKEISLRMQPQQVVQRDGELLGMVDLPLTCSVQPRALSVVVPA